MEHRSGILRHGLTVVELMVAVLVFGVALIPLFDIFRMSSATIRMEREHLIATYLATELVDQIACFPYRTIPEVNGIPIQETEGAELYLVQDQPATRLVLTALPEGFERTLTIHTLSGNLKKIKAIVAWGRGAGRNVSSQTLLEWTP